MELHCLGFKPKLRWSMLENKKPSSTHSWPLERQVR
jgi:hypothetical protein